MLTSAQSCDRMACTGLFVNYIPRYDMHSYCKKHIYFSLTPEGWSFRCQHNARLTGKL